MPLVSAHGLMTPMPPFWVAVPEQLHWPLPSFEHLTSVQPTPEMEIFSQATSVDEIDRHEGASGNLIEPVVVVPSLYVPSLLAVQVPVTSSEPVTGTVLHPRLARVTSMSPDKVRHDDITFHVPTTEPPQGVAVEHFGGPCVPPDPLPEDPPLPVVPPLADEPPLPCFPPEPTWLTEGAQPLLAPRTTATDATSPINLFCIEPRGGYLSGRGRDCSEFFHWRSSSSPSLPASG